MKTYSAKAESVERDWYIVDAEGKTLGRLAVEVASRLRGKHKPEYTPHTDIGDYVVVTNCQDLQVTGNKREKVYYRHTGYPGGIKSRTLGERLDRRPDELLVAVVRPMLPKGSLGRAMIRKLKVYPGSDHKHQAQQLIPLKQIQG